MRFYPKKLITILTAKYEQFMKDKFSLYQKFSDGEHKILIYSFFKECQVNPYYSCTPRVDVIPSIKVSINIYFPIINKKGLMSRSALFTKLFYF